MHQNQSNYLSRPPGALWRLMIFYFDITNEFLRETVLNGLKYLTFKYLTFLEKLFFLCCFAAATYYSANFAMGIVEKWQTSPVITVMNNQMSSIREDPFPAITICNMNQAQHSKVKDFDVKSLDYAMLQKLCFQEINYSSFSHNQQRPKNDSFANFIVKNTQSCSHMVASCKYGRTDITCSDLFREALLDEGMCCVFNAVHPYLLYKGDFFMVRDYTSTDGPAIPLDWSPEKGYPKNLPPSFYPRVPLSHGMSNGFTIVLNGDYDNYYCSSTNGPGFKVSLHNPIDTPNVKDTGLSVRLGFQTTFRVTPIREDASESLRKFTSPQKRQCYFSDEYSLQYFRYYTQSNCEMECDAEFMLQKCDCIPYHMPLLSNNVTSCHVRHFDCVVEAEKDLDDQTRLKCRKDCLANCNDLSYYPKAFVASLDNEGFAVTSKNHYLRNMSKDDLNKHAVLKIFYPQNYYRGSIKNPYIGVTEFLSQVGGLMGLMMGFSVISIVEFAYFFVIKPFICAWKKLFYKSTIDVIEINATQPDEILQYPKPNRKYQHFIAPHAVENPHFPPLRQNINQLDYVN